MNIRNSISTQKRIDRLSLRINNKQIFQEEEALKEVERRNKRREYALFAYQRSWDEEVIEIDLEEAREQKWVPVPQQEVEQRLFKRGDKLLDRIVDELSSEEEEILDENNPHFGLSKSEIAELKRLEEEEKKIVELERLASLGLLPTSPKKLTKPKRRIKTVEEEEEEEDLIKLEEEERMIEEEEAAEEEEEDEELRRIEELEKRIEEEEIEEEQDEVLRETEEEHYYDNGSDIQEEDEKEGEDSDYDNLTPEEREELKRLEDEEKLLDEQLVSDSEEYSS